MKKYLQIATALLLITACNQPEQDGVSTERDSLVSIINERDSSLSDFVTAFNSIETNLDSVTAKQNIIVSVAKPGEMQPNQKNRINLEIAAINSLMEKNRIEIARLSKRARSSTNKNVELEKAILTLNAQLTEKTAELADLNIRLSTMSTQVAHLEIVVDTLTSQNTAQAQEIATETKALHTAYFIVGKSRDLQDAKVIDRQGGLLGIGRTSKLKTDFDVSKFTRIDYTQTNSIAVNSDIKIITNHPSGSYQLEMDLKNKKMVKNIVIVNPENFWSSSKYLVVVKD